MAAAHADLVAVIDEGGAGQRHLQGDGATDLGIDEVQLGGDAVAVVVANQNGVDVLRIDAGVEATRRVE